MPTKRDGNELIGKKALPIGYGVRRAKASEARAYYNLAPYPVYGLFREWREDQRGPLPKCWPMPKSIIDEAARWLFGKELKFNTGDKEQDQQAGEWLSDVWEANKMPLTMLKSATRAGYEGSVVLGWTYEPDEKDMPVRIQAYSPIEHARMFYDPHDDDRLIMVRLQYAYWDPLESKWFFYREDWTADRYVRYEPQPIQGLWRNDILTNPRAVVSYFDEMDVWANAVAESGKNEAGVIPFKEIRNLDIGRGFGEGDLWSLFPLIDQYNLTRHLENVDNQVSAWPHRIYIDLKPESGEEPQAVGPDAVESLRSSGEKQGKVEKFESSAATRPHMRDHADDVEKHVRDAAGYPRIDVSEITNKGNFTAAVMRMIFGKHIATTNVKRRHYGEYGIGPFLEDMVKGLKAANCPEVKMFPEDLNVQIVWPDYFEVIADELLTNVSLQSSMIEAGFQTTERAVKEIAVLRGVDDPDALKEEIEKEQKENASKNTEEDRAEEPEAGS